MVGLVAERVRELIRQICHENEVEIIKGHILENPHILTPSIRFKVTP
jgi:hypothetical protein